MTDASSSHERRFVFVPRATASTTRRRCRRSEPPTSGTNVRVWNERRGERVVVDRSNASRGGTRRDPSIGQSSVPVRPTGWRVVAASKGGCHTCGIDLAGGLACWGCDAHGQVSAVPGGGGTGWIDVSAGKHFSCGITSTERAVRCWGKFVPQINGPWFGPWAAVTAGEDWVCAVGCNVFLLPLPSPRPESFRPSCVLSNARRSRREPSLHFTSNDAPLRRGEAQGRHRSVSRVEHDGAGGDTRGGGQRVLGGALGGISTHVRGGCRG